MTRDPRDLMEETADSPVEAKQYRIDFIDPLFAVALHIGLVESLLQEDWIHEWRIPRGVESFNLFVLVLGVLTVVLSWVGYHESIRRKPLIQPARFALDVILVLAYAVMLAKADDLEAVIALLAFIYVVFVLWDIAKVREWRSAYADDGSFLERFHREVVTAGWAIYFLVLAAVALSTSFSRNATLALAFAGTILYRANKARAVFRDVWRSIRIRR